MKIRYILQNINTNEIHERIYYLDIIEREGLKALFDTENYAIKYRDRFTGMLDNNRQEIYENDIFRYTSKKYSSRGRVLFKKGMFGVSVSRKDEGDKFIELNKYLKHDLTVIGSVHKKEKYGNII